MDTVTHHAIRKRLRTLIQSLKRQYFSADNRPWSPEHAVLTELISDHRRGEAINRLFVILCGPGCWYALSENGPCINCGFLDVTTHGKAVSTDQYLRQLEQALTAYDFERQDIRELDLYNAGSFFRDTEIAPASRDALLGRIAKLPSVKYVLVDCHVKDVKYDKTRRACAALGEKNLELGIGLESADDFVRNICINKGMELDEFERAAQIIKRAGAWLAVYVLFKPAFLSENEAIEDAIKTLKYVFELAGSIDVPIRISIEPAVIQGISLLPYLYERGLYKPAWLWSIVEVIKATAHLGEIRVGVPEEEPAIFARPQNYVDNDQRACSCSRHVTRCIEQYNQGRDVSVFDSLPTCRCRSLWQRVREEPHPPLRQRVECFIGDHAGV